MAELMKRAKEYVRACAYERGGGVIDYLLLLAVMVVLVVVTTKVLGTDPGTLYRQILGWL